MERAVAKVVGVLETLCASEEGLDLRQLARRTGLSRSAAHRAVTALAERGFVTRDGEARRYRIGPWGLRLARAYGQAETLLAVSRPYLQRLRDLTQETVCLSVPCGGQCVCVEELPSPRFIKFSQGVGAAAPLYAGASGKVLLAHFPSPLVHRLLQRVRLLPLTPRTISEKAILRKQLAEIRRRGYASSRGERIPGAAAVAVPVFGPAGQPAAALGVFGPDSRLTAERTRQILPALREAAAGLAHVVTPIAPARLTPARVSRRRHGTGRDRQIVMEVTR